MNNIPIMQVSKIHPSDCKFVIEKAWQQR